MSDAAPNIITVTDTATPALARLAPEKILPLLARTMDQQNQLTVGHIQKKYLSFSKGGPSNPEGLRVQSNRLRGSIRASKTILTGAGLQSAIGSNVSYAAAHEFGATIPAHDVVAKSGKALRFLIGGKVVFARRVHIPAITLPARRFVQRGIADRLPNYTRALSKVILAQDASTGGAA